MGVGSMYFAGGPFTGSGSGTPQKEVGGLSACNAYADMICAYFFAFLFCLFLVLAQSK